MKLLSKDKLNIAAQCIQSGGLVAFPTETVYGLGANALNPIAVAGIFEAKKRPNFDPLIVHIADKEKIKELFEDPIDPLVFKLIDKFWPGPLTVVHKKSSLVPDIVTSGLNDVAVRMPSHPIALELIRLSEVPVAAPSANLFGHLSPTTHEHVVKQNMDIDYIVQDAEENTLNVGIESTVVAIENGICTILRPGVITAKDIENAIPDITIHTPGKNIKIASPGLLKSHYSPTKPLYFLTEESEVGEGSGVILHTKTKEHYQIIQYTSYDGNLLEVASNLFSALHKMEENPNVTTIYIEKVEEIGIGVAIMDRLYKATHQYVK